MDQSNSQLIYQSTFSKSLRLFAAFLLFLALLDWDYSYFQILRVVVCGVSAYSAWYFILKEKEGWVWLFGAVAVLFNPIFIITMHRETWQIIDIGVATVILFSLFTKGKNG